MLDDFDVVTGFDLKGDGLTGECLHEDLHVGKILSLEARVRSPKYKDIKIWKVCICSMEGTLLHGDHI